jgi:hypothetical protein
MDNWKSVLSTIAPVVATALGGPLAGAVVSKIGDILGLDEPTQDKIRGAIEAGNLTGEQLAEIKTLEIKLKAEEAERGFRYADLEFKDREGARQMAIQTGAKTPAILTWLIVAIVLGLEGALLFGAKPDVSEIVLGRILGTLDASLAMTLAFWFGTTHGSSRKTEMLSAK